MPLSSWEPAVEDWEQVCVPGRRQTWIVSTPVHDPPELHLKMVGTCHPSSRLGPLSIARSIHLQCILSGLWVTGPPQRQPAIAFEKPNTTALLLPTHLGVVTFQPRTGRASLISWHLSVLTRPASPTRYPAPLHTRHPVCRCIGVAESCIACNRWVHWPEHPLPQNHQK